MLGQIYYVHNGIFFRALNFSTMRYNTNVGKKTWGKLCYIEKIWAYFYTTNFWFSEYSRLCHFIVLFLGNKMCDICKNIRDNEDSADTKML